MLDKSITGLIDRYLEGTLDQEQTLQVENILKNNSEAARYCNDWKEIQKEFEDIRAKSGEVNVIQEVMRRIPEPVKRSGQTPAFSSPVLLRQRAWIYSSLFIAGVFAGLLIFHILIIPGPTNGDGRNVLSGTMADKTEPEYTDTLQAGNGQNGVLILVAGSKNSVDLMLKFHSETPLNCLLTYDSGTSVLTSAVADNPSLVFTLITSPGEIELTAGQSDQCRLTIRKLTPEPVSFVLSLSRSSETAADEIRFQL